MQKFVSVESGMSSLERLLSIYMQGRYGNNYGGGEQSLPYGEGYTLENPQGSILSNPLVLGGLAVGAGLIMYAVVK